MNPPCPAVFAEIAREVSRLWPAYIAQRSDLYHVGDEMLSTPALMLLRRRGLIVNDALGAKLITRWWSARTNHPQPSFAAVQTASILHLPSDKSYLASWAGRPFDPARFVASYRSNIAGELRKRRFANPFLNLSRRERKYVARLG